MLTAGRLREVLHYDEQTGVFMRIAASGKRQTRPDLVGRVAGGYSGNGYRMISVDGKSYLAHRLAWLYVVGRFPIEHIDHRDGNPANNAWSNLRECDASKNLANSRAHKKTCSGRKGVTYCRRTGMWRAKIQHRGHHIHIGRFDSIDKASAAYVAKARELFGEFARPA